jgi:hypothetical protein
MSMDVETLLPQVTMRPAYPSEEVEELIADFVAEVGNIPHPDYLDFMRRHAGCDGPVGQQGYLTLWPLEEVISGTEEAGGPQFAPGLLLFAGDGGDEAYAFDRQTPGWPIVSVPLVGLSRNAMKLVANTFGDFIRKLASDEV